VCVAFATSIPMLIVLDSSRVSVLGGAMPSATAISSEYVPRRDASGRGSRSRSSASRSAEHSPADRRLHPAAFRLARAVRGRRNASLVLAAVLFKILPESPRYMARIQARWAKLRALLRRLGHDVRTMRHLSTRTRRLPSARRSASCFVPEFRWDTIVLFACFLFCSSARTWARTGLPSMLDKAKFDVGTASYGLLAWNLGVLAFALLAAFIIPRAGSRATMLTLAGGFDRRLRGARDDDITPAVDRAGLHHARHHRRPRQRDAETTMYALAANVYPTAIRGTGVGTTVAVGRIGGVLSPLVGAIALTGGTYALGGCT